MAVRKSSNKLPPFVPLLWDVLNSKAYKAVTYASAKALPYFLGKYKGLFHDPQRYELEFHFSYSEANRYGFPTATFSKVIQELIRKGFIDPVDKGGLKSCGHGYNRFRLSRRWEKYGSNEFESMEWKCFVPRPRIKATSKREMHSFRKGNETTSVDSGISQIEVVGGFSR